MNKNFSEITIPFEEAENYFKPSNKEKLNTFFYKDKNYEKIIQDTTYYILGDKGSGKTTYAAYFCNGFRDGIKSSRYVLSVDDYGKIITMKKEKQLNYTSYTTMWKAILLIKLISTITDGEVNSIFSKSNVLSSIKKVLNDFDYNKLTIDSFSPVKIIDNSNFISSFINQIKIKSSGVQDSAKFSYNYSKSHESKHSLMVFEDLWTKFINNIAGSIKNLKLKNHHYLFVDGIDVRPDEIPYNDYKKCVSSLVRAVYDVNSEILSQLKDSKKGRLQIILLSRLDIFLTAGLSNPGSKVTDNCAFLDWSVTNENEYKQSDIYALVNQIISQGSIDSIEPWPLYFNFKIMRGNNSFDPFIYFLRLTNARPRDFVRIFSILSDMCNKSNKENPSASQIESDKFQNMFSTYFTDAIRTALGFYYDKEQIKLLFDFVKTLHHVKFSYKQFKGAYNNFVRKDELKNTYGESDKVIELLFNENIVSIFDPKGYYRCKYREISISNYDYGLETENLTPNTTFLLRWAFEKEFDAYLK
ncbi:P-loop ATPase, Sll1717 family [Caproicibacterium amylolyticum]|uniref:FunZ protein n=1 Tax=Caproicibacterium amylolyticum TaxID=2766537 RepID=A0A7G9WG64_9FIRM|nr:hypothetical protein [Caproicibacterium amylolyticum]QNO17676.1 hypothetical protein H6X83_12215 [Caproicibacterium amylolyticum]